MKDQVTILHGDCRDVMRELEESSIDALICDPPYGLEFMGKEWDKLGDADGFRRSRNQADVGREDLFGRTSRTSPEYKLGGASLERTAKSAGGFGKDSPTNENAFAAARVRFGKSVANMQEWHRTWAVEALRVLKPGAHALVFGGTRTHHRLMCGLEDAGFEIRDCVMWVYGSGFPKSLDVSKAIDKANGVEGSWRQEEHPGRPGNRKSRKPIIGQVAHATDKNPDGLRHVYESSTDQAKQWDGWGTALKPAWEPIIIARKPIQGTVAENVLEYGTGAMNIDGCRIDGAKASGSGLPPLLFNGQNHRPFHDTAEPREFNTSKGRWPANLIHDGSEEVTGLFPNANGKGHYPRERGLGGIGNDGHKGQSDLAERFNEPGSAARFFYTPKASGSDRGNKTDPALPLFGIEEEEFRNTHPTVKPVALMEYLIKLVTKPGQIVLDCFAGSGSTGVAALNLDRKIILIERDSEYLPIIKRRCSR